MEQHWGKVGQLQDTGLLFLFRLCFKSCLVSPQQILAQCCRLLPPKLNPGCRVPEYASRAELGFPWKSSQWPASLASWELKSNHNFSSVPFSSVVNVHSGCNAIQNTSVPPKPVHHAWFNYSHWTNSLYLFDQKFIDLTPRNISFNSMHYQDYPIKGKKTRWCQHWFEKKT